MLYLSSYVFSKKWVRLLFLTCIVLAVILEGAILVGGRCDCEEISEAEAMRRYLVEKGVDGSRLILEDRSTDTYENIRNSFALMGDNNLKICVVTSDFHLLRAKMLAYKQGRQVGGLSAPAYLPLIPNYHVREMMAVLKDLVSIKARFPAAARCANLHRKKPR